MSRGREERGAQDADPVPQAYAVVDLEVTMKLEVIEPYGVHRVRIDARVVGDSTEVVGLLVAPTSVLAHAPIGAALKIQVSL